MTLDMFKDDFVPWSTSHVEALIREWKKLSPAHKLFEYNRDTWMKKFNTECSEKQLEYYAGLNIPYYSGWASIVLNKRFPLKTIQEMKKIARKKRK